MPPLKGKGIGALCKHLDPLMEFKPAYINVTYHRSEHIFKKRADGNFEKVVIRKRPGTEAICASIMNKYNVDTVPHLICGGFSVQDTEDALLTLSYLGIDNVLVLRGDAAKNETGNSKGRLFYTALDSDKTGAGKGILYVLFGNYFAGNEKKDGSQFRSALYSISYK